MLIEEMVAENNRLKNLILIIKVISLPQYLMEILKPPISL